MAGFMLWTFLLILRSMQQHMTNKLFYESIAKRSEGCLTGPGVTDQNREQSFCRQIKPPESYLPRE